MKRILFVAALVIGFSGQAFAQSAPARPGPSAANELQQLQTEIRKLNSMLKSLDEKLTKLEQGRRSAGSPFGGMGSFGGGASEGPRPPLGGNPPRGFSTSGTGGIGRFSIIDGSPAGFGGGTFGGGGTPARAIGITVRRDDDRPAAGRFADRPERRDDDGPGPRGPRPSASGDLDRKLDRILRELEEIRREMRHR